MSAKSAVRRTLTYSSSNLIETASLPLGVVTACIRRRCLSSSVARPAALTTDVWTKMSLSPSSAWMNPKPLVGLNHLTSPKTLTAVEVSMRGCPCDRGGAFPASRWALSHHADLHHRGHLGTLSALADLDDQRGAGRDRIDACGLDGVDVQEGVA